MRITPKIIFLQTMTHVPNLLVEGNKYENKQNNKKVLRVLLIWCMTRSFLPTTVFATAEESGFTYGVYDASAGTIKITGYTGDLEPGQDLVVPSEIAGKPVVSIEGKYGAAGASLGRFILPDTLQNITNLHVLGFTGSFVIPESVTNIDRSGICMYGPEEYVINATLETYPAGYSATHYGDNNPLKRIVIGGSIKYFLDSVYFFPSNYPNLETIEVSDTVQFINIQESMTGDGFCTATFYLKRFTAPVVKMPDDGYEPIITPTGETTEARGLAVGLQKCNYSYTNTGEDLPVEYIFVTETTGFTTFREDDPSSMFGPTSYPGLYVGWSSSIQVNTTPINASNTEDIHWSSSDETVATVENGIITAKDIGKTTISAIQNGLTVEYTIVVRGIYIVSTDDGVNADNLPGNMEIPDVDLNPQAGISLELEVDKLNPKDWTQWGQLKKVLEEALNKSLECSDAFDIQVKLKNGTYTWKVQPIESKRISIWMPIENAQDISKRHLVHLKDNGTYEELDFEYEPIDGVHGIRFETTSFSSFILLEDACSDVPEKQNLAITTQPKSVTVAQGATAKVSFTATGDGRQIYCVVKDKYGNSVQSNTITLSMKP